MGSTAPHSNQHMQLGIWRSCAAHGTSCDRVKYNFMIVENHYPCSSTKLVSKLAFNPIPRTGSTAQP
jgi:hypothetical protein